MREKFERFLSNKKEVALFVTILTFAFVCLHYGEALEALFTPVPTAPALRETVEPLVQALSEARESVLLYSERHGILPDIVSSEDWTADGKGGYSYSRASFDVVTGGGKLAIAIIAEPEKTIRLIGVVGGSLLKNPDTRLAASRIKGGSGDVALYRYDGKPFGEEDKGLYILLEPRGFISSH